MKTSNTSKSRAFLLRPLAQALAASALLSLPLAAVSQVLPSGLQVVRGQAQVSTQGQQMTVTNSPNAILNWNQFGIGTGYGVHFQQANAASKVLNRVVGQDPSQILGSLTSNGQVWLLNPNGILFGAQARVDVASLVASTLNLSDQDWLSGRLRFEQDASLPGGSIVNQGELRGAQGGQVVLLAADVRNEGQVSAPQGQAVLAAGRQIELVDTATPHVRVRLLAEAGEVLNSGWLQAEDGRIDVHAAAVRQQGQVHADGARGGEVLLQAGSGRLTQLGEVSARGTQGSGGQIQLLGREVVVDGQARIDASGATGGGEILVGGGLQGKDARVPNARAVFFGSEATARADALQQGQGGTVVLWSDESTRAYGHFSARGGAQGGAGGLVETSGGWLDARPASMRVDAARGAAGTWLIDPYNVLISDGRKNAVSATGSSPLLLAPTGTGSVVSTSTLASALASGQNVTVTTSGAGSEAGDISWSGNLSVASMLGAQTLTLIADRNVVFSGGSISTSGLLSLDVQAGRSGTGSVVALGLTVSSNGGVTMGGYAGAAAPGSGSQAGIRLENVDFSLSGDLTLRAANTAGFGGVELLGGDFSVRRFSVDGKATTGKGIYVDAAQVIAEESAVLRGEGSDVGVQVRNGARIEVSHDGYLASGTLDIQGTGRGSSAVGVAVEATTGSAALVAQQVGSLKVLGTTDSTSANAVYIAGSAASSPYPALEALQVPALTVEALQGPIFVTGAQINQDDGGTSPRNVLIKGPALTLNRSTVMGGGLIRLQADSQVFQSASQITALSLPVPAVIIGMDGVQGAARIDNQTGPSLFAANISQWTVVGQHPLDSATFTAGQNQFNPGGLNPNYKAYGTTGYDTTFIAGKGNGFHFSSPVYAAITGTALDKVYDGTTAASVSGLGASGLAGDTLTLKPGVTAVFRDKNVGTDKPLDLTSSDAFTAVDGSGRPIYGYSVGASGLTANITPLAVLVSGLSAQDKVYDGSTVAGLVGTASYTVLPGDSVSLINPTGEFSDRHVGTAKPVSLSGLSFGGADAGNYMPVAVGVLKADITPRPATVSGLQAQSKVYDGSDVATLGGTPVLSILAGDQVNLAGALDARFNNKQVGTAKPVTVSGLSFGGTDAANYSFTLSGSLSADITPRVLNLAGVQVGSKVYDGSATAPLSGTPSISPVAGDQVALAGTLQAQFGGSNAAGVGQAKPVQLSGLTLGGADASNYTLALPALSGVVTPATLTYVATPAQRLVGQLVGQLSGSVTGFVAGESLATATTGSLQFTAPAVGGANTPALVEGSFAIVGSGLSAANYSFAQAAGNASALVVYALTPEILAQTPAVTPVGGGGSGGAGGSDPGTPPGVPPLGGTGPSGGPLPPLGVLDLSSPLPPVAGGGGTGAPAGGAAGAGSGGSAGGSLGGTSGGSSGGSGGSAGSGGGAGTGGGLASGAGIAAAGARFGAVDLGGMSMDAIQQLLDERNRIKRKLFEEALTRLESNPGLADLQTCTNRKEAEAGNCLVTEALRLELQAEASGAPSAIKPPASPAPGAAPAPAPSTAAPAVAQAPAAPLPPAFSQRRAVKTAALPQIERKIALVIGVNDYQDRNIPQLEGAVGDAEAMASLVESRLGYETVLLRNATKTQVVAALNRLALELRPQDSVLVYYAGHGDEINVPEGGKQGYWQLADSDAKRPETWLSNNDIGRLMRAMSARQVALLSDSCYSGSLVTGQRLRAVPAPGALNPNEVLGERTVVVMSSGGNAPVADSGENGHSPFAFHLFQTLGEVPSWKPGANVFETVRFMVARKFPQSPQYGFSGPVNVPKPVDYLFEQRKLDQR